MRRSLLGFTVLAAVVLLLPTVSASGANGHANYRAVCPGRVTGTAHCHELVVTNAHGNPLARNAPSGLSPATIDSAYGFSDLSGAGKTIAIVDAYDDPNAESDLGTFSSQYGLPSCTTANGCFRKVNQSGGTSYPRANAGWALEISLDVQWAHAIAPDAHILLVEASSNSFADLMTAESYAGLHAQYVSNSWGGSEFAGETSYDNSYFSASGVSYFVAAGDNGGSAAEYPSASPKVISVGGTTLHFDGSGNFTGETGWSDGGGGCSAYETATSAQAGYSNSLCGSARATPDVSLDADPNSGVSVFDSVKYYGQTGWFTVGGTSASTPMWAARSADYGSTVNASTVYGSAIPFRDITSGDNGNPCLTGYDLCTGRGSWNDGGGGGTTNPDFTLSATPSSRTVTQGSSTSYSVSISPTGGFSGGVNLSVAGLPGSGVNASFNPNPATSSATLDVTTTATASTGTYELTITGTSGSLSHSTNVSLTIQAPQAGGFTLSASPGNRTVRAGQSATYAISVSPSGGYSGDVNLAVSGAPGGYSFSPNPVGAGSSSTLTVDTSGAHKGTYTMTITGTDTSDPSLTNTIMVRLKIH